MNCQKQMDFAVEDRMCKFQKIDFQSIRLHERMGGWLAGDYPYADSACHDVDTIAAFLSANPAIMVEIGSNLLCQRELGLAMTRVFYLMQEEKQSPVFVERLNGLFERVSSWYEEDDDKQRYLLVQGEGISEECIEAFHLLKKQKKLPKLIEKLYLDAEICSDLQTSGYYRICRSTEKQEPIKLCTEEDQAFLRRLLYDRDFRKYGSMNVSGLSMEELEHTPFLDCLLKEASFVYLYVFDLCMKKGGEREKKYVKILHWYLE